MKFSTIVEHDDSGLLMVLDALDELREDRFIEGIRSKQRSHYEIMQMTEYPVLLGPAGLTHLKILVF